MHHRCLALTLLAGCFPITTVEPTPSVPDTCDHDDPTTVISVVSGDGRDLVPVSWEVMVDLDHEEDDVGIVVRGPSGAEVPLEIYGNRQSFAVYPLVSWDG